MKIIVYGTPVPQGSMRAFYNPKTKVMARWDSNKKVKPWRQEIAGAAVEAMAGKEPIEKRGCIVDLLFCFDRPKSLRKSELHKLTKPDVDKLTRTVLDALTGTVFKDDAQVVRIEAQKIFDSTPRAEINISFLTPAIESRARR